MVVSWEFFLKGNNLKLRDLISIVLNIVIVIFVGIGTSTMFASAEPGAALTASGLSNLKYFTVLSNEFCGIVAILWLIFRLMRKSFPVLPKLMAAAAVALTFIIIAAFLQPIYSDLNLYQGSNLWFHLIVPLTAMLEFVLLKTEEKIPFRYAMLSAILALLYGTAYLINILANGVGTWPDTNDWYGFLNWGWPVGFGIFAFIVLMDFGAACLLRFISNLANHRKN